MHTYIFEEGEWEVTGFYDDLKNEKVEITGFHKIRHTSKKWIVEVEIKIMYKKIVKKYLRYYLNPFRNYDNDNFIFGESNDSMLNMYGTYSINDKIIEFEQMTMDSKHSSSEKYLQLEKKCIL